jgi:hypothetical protein
MQHEPYQLADKEIKRLNRKAIKRFSTAKRNLARIDELNVVEVSKELYSGLESDNEQAFLELARTKYEETEPHGAAKPNRKWLIALLLMYSPVTQYVYKNEVERKRQYMQESVSGALKVQQEHGAGKKISGISEKEFRKALSYWSNFTAQYADIVEYESTIKAYTDSGVKKVMWHTKEDERVCEECGPRDKQIYPIDKIPPKPHWHCRCWVTPVIEDSKQQGES